MNQREESKMHPMPPHAIASGAEMDTSKVNASSRLVTPAEHQDKAPSSFSGSKDQDAKTCSHGVGCNQSTESNLSNTVANAAYSKSDPEDKFLTSTTGLDCQGSKPQTLPGNKAMHLFHKYRYAFFGFFLIMLASAIGVGVWASKKNETPIQGGRVKEVVLAAEAKWYQTPEGEWYQVPAETIPSLLNREWFNSVSAKCNVHVDLYDSMTAAFGTTPLPGGLNELAIMMGNLALESIKFTATHRWGCDWHPEWCDRYYGRGYIQLTGYDNYARAANAIGIDIVNDPDQVANDPVVNWKTVLFYWTDRVQPLFWERGLSLSTSVLAIDPDENCASRGGSTNWDRVALIQCFQDGWLGYHDEGTEC